MKISLDTARIEPVSKPFEETVSVPGSKSYSLRALFISALCDKPFKINDLLDSDDVNAMKRCLEALSGKRIDIDAGESGLTARFMIALACLNPGVQIITGASGLQKRPVKDLVDALRSLGADIEYVRRDGYLPVEVKSSELKGGKVALKGDVSSQYLSALLLIAPRLENGLAINIHGKQTSKPYIDMTIDIMRYFGVDVENQGYKKYVIKAQKYTAKDYTVEGDYSSAAYFFAAAALNRSKITVENLNPASKQADKEFLNILEKMNAKITFADNSVTVSGHGVRPVHINMENCPDQAMTLAVLAAFADGKTTIDGIGSLRIKETERIKALENELAKMGISTSSTRDSLSIKGAKPSGAKIDSYGDHRIAMSFAVAGTKTTGVEIIKPGVVNKTFPGFWKELSKLTGVEKHRIKASNLLLIGMRGSGKTTVGKVLAKKLGKKFIDMDIYLEIKHGKKVRDIVLDEGWEHFRKLETEACEQLSREKDCVISSGGGIVLDQKNMDLFRENSVIMLLKADPRILSRRIRSDENRPELSTQPTLLGELGEVWEKRKEMYFKNADFMVETTRDNPRKIASEILSKLGPQICMVIGDPIEHSLSPDIHNLGYKLLGLEDQFEYRKKRVSSDGIEAFIKQMRDDGIRGASLTMPHKELVLPFLDKIDPVAKQIGAVNTIVNDNGKLTGYNTDWIGVIKPLEKRIVLRGKKAAVIGAGGAAKAFVYALMEAGCEVTVYNRTPEKAEEIGKKFGCGYASLNELGKINNADIICNTTSVGMNGKSSIIDRSYLRPGQIVFDAVYVPLATQMLKDAAAKGAKPVFGLEMLLAQAFEQFKLFTGKDAPEEDISSKIMEKISEG